MSDADRIPVLSLTLGELEQWMEQTGQKKFRAKQIYEWLHVRHACLPLRTEM